MVSTVSAESARKSAPASESWPVDLDSGSAPLSPQERAASALAAREFGSNPAPRGSVHEAWDAERREFDAAHALDFVSVYDAFAHAYQDAYGRRYERTLHADWKSLRDFVREFGWHTALEVIDRAFSEPLLVGAGIRSVGVVHNLAATLVAPRPLGVRSRLDAAQRRLCEAVIAERAGASA